MDPEEENDIRRRKARWFIVVAITIVAILGVLYYNYFKPDDCTSHIGFDIATRPVTCDSISEHWSGECKCIDNLTLECTQSDCQCNYYNSTYTNCIWGNDGKTTTDCAYSGNICKNNACVQD